MVLAPKWNLRHKHHRAGCGLAGPGCFALEKQIQTWNTLLALWTGSNKATFTSFFPPKKNAPSLYLPDRDASVSKRRGRKKLAETKVLKRLAALVAVQYWSLLLEIILSFLVTLFNRSYSIWSFPTFQIFEYQTCPTGLKGGCKKFTVSTLILS